MSQRRLAAILSADVVGYSRLMANDEDATVRTLEAYREEIGVLIRQHRGRVVDAAGDNLLAELPTATDAVEAAVEIQRVIEARNAALSEGRKMEFRIGVHLGEVRVEGDRLYGDGVNIAARLEGLAEPGGICVSAEVRRQVARRLELNFEDLGEQSVKNIPDSVHVFRLRERAEGFARAAGGAAVAATARPRAARPAVVAAVGVVVALVLAAIVYRATRSSAPTLSTTTPSGAPLTAIAVLPFDDLSPHGDQQWLANGMAEDLIEMLSRSEALQVVARTSAHVAKEKGGDVPAIGELLNVGSVVEGSVRSANDRLRVAVQLIRVEDGYHLWSGRYDRRLDDVFAIQQEIGREIAEALRAELGVADTYSWLKSARYQPRDVHAYELVKKAFDLLLPMRAADEEGIREGINYAQQALEIDRDYAHAHAQLGWGYYYLWLYRFDPSEQTRDRARAAAQRALDLEPTNGGAATLLVNLSLDDGNWESAKNRVESALETAPGDGLLHVIYGVTLLSIGSLEEAAREMQRGADLDPLVGFTQYEVGNLEVGRRNYEAAVASYERGEELGDYPSLAGLPFAHHLNGMDQEALEAWVRFSVVRFPTGEMEKALRQAYEQGGLVDATGVVLDALVSRYGTPCSVNAWYGARMLALIDEPERMFACLEESIQQHRVERLAKVHPIYDPYRADPRFQALLERLHLAE